MNSKLKSLLIVLVVALFAISLASCASAPEVDTAAQEAAEKAAAEAQAKLEEMEAQLAEAQAAAEAAGSASKEELAAAQAALEEAKAEADAAAAAAAEAEAKAEAMVSTEMDFLTWYQYDETNEDPASDERVGNQYLRDTIPQFNEEFDGKWNWVNRPKAWDKMTAELVAAVIAVLIAEVSSVEPSPVAPNHSGFA